MANIVFLAQMADVRMIDMIKTILSLCSGIQIVAMINANAYGGKRFNL